MREIVWIAALFIGFMFAAAVLFLVGGMAYFKISDWFVRTWSKQWHPGRGEISLPPLVSTSRSFGDVVRARRSALDFRDGGESISFSQLATVLSSAQKRLFADFATARFVRLYLYVHRVDDLTPGVYRYWPEQAELEKIKDGGQRLVAAALSLGQDLAGNASVAFSMIGDFESAARCYGDRGYRYVHFEAGAIGQRMYLACEALGLRATGIGAFFDDKVNHYLDLSPELGQVVYHFAIGHPVPDPRLEAWNEWSASWSTETTTSFCPARHLTNQPHWHWRGTGPSSKSVRQNPRLSANGKLGQKSFERTWNGR
jgi:SagB-type dehydrogenase family enzyme